MSDAYIGEIRLFAGIRVPENWAFCDGSLQSVSEQQALFALIGTIYGGNGVTNFALPDLRSRVPVSMGTAVPSGTTYAVGQVGGAETVTLTAATLPAHSHTFNATSTVAKATTPSATTFLGTVSDVTEGTRALYIPPSSTLTATPLDATAVQTGGGSNQAHPNIMPSMGINFMICLVGIFPQKAT
jgi:microcystin-dependent protein